MLDITTGHFYRDGSQIATGADCYYQVDDQTIYATWNNANYSEQYKLIGNQYEKMFQTPTAITNTNTVTCQNYSFFQTQLSHYDFITPIYYSMAIITSIALFYLAYKLMIYPFFRGKI